MTKPPLLYKYQAITLRTLESLKTQSLYFGSPLNFNDPYDCALSPNIADLSNEEVERARKGSLDDPNLEEASKRAMKRITLGDFRTMLNNAARSALTDHIRGFLTKRGVTCFSEQKDNLLMWSHYGDSYKGICLEFSTDFPPFDKIRKVMYSNKIPTISASRIYGHEEDNGVMDLFCTKSEAWAYEKEWRGIHKEVRTFGYPSECLTAVHFGPNATPESKEIVCLILGGQNAGVKFFEGVRSQSEFKVEFKEFTYVSHLEARRQGLVDENGERIPN